MRALITFAFALGAALAPSASMAGDGGWYGALHLGKGWKEDADMQFMVSSETTLPEPSGAPWFSLDQTFDADLAYTSGWGFGLAAGRAFGNWRAEGELTWRKSRVGGFELTGHDARIEQLGELPPPFSAPTFDLDDLAGLVNEDTVGLSGKASLVTTVLNLYYDFPAAWPVKPYAGAGIGAVHANKTKKVALKVPVFQGCSPQAPCIGEDRHRRSWDFTWQLMAGVRYPFADAWDATLGWRYASLSNVKFGLLEGAGDFGAFDEDPLQIELGGMHSIELGVLRRF